MPILWRYLLQSYLRVFLLSVSSFVGVLFVLRFKDVARFATLSSDLINTGLFVVYQFPLILPMAIPISALIASFLLFQRLSQSHELTAFRASGISLKMIMTPLIFASLFLSLLNFSICAELSPYCRRESKNLLYKKNSTNPLLLLQRQQLVKIKNIYMNMKVEKEGQAGKDLFLIVYNNGLNLLTAKKLWIEQDELMGKEVAIVSYLLNEEKESFDPLVLENQSTMSTSAPLLSQAMKKKKPNLEANALNFRHLRIQKENENTPFSHEKKNVTDKKSRLALIEILRRYSLSGAVFSFTLLGCAFGIEQGRNPNRRNLFYALGWTLLVLVSYLTGKSLRAWPVMAVFALLLPHLLLWIASIRRFLALSRGTL